MLVFPQLETKTTALYPVERMYAARTVGHEVEGGQRTIFSDVDATRREWELRALGLTKVEVEAIEALFSAAGGRLRTFTFLDPVGNLLTRSEEFADPVWTAGPALVFTPGHADPFGTTRATQVVNSGGAPQTLSQSAAVPGAFQYAFSLWARSAGLANVSLTASSGAANAAQTLALGTAWRRFSMLISLGAAADSVTFGVQLPAGVGIDIFGAQVEAQPGTSDYKRTGGASGVFSNVRFATDRLAVRAQGTDVFDALLRLETVGS